MVHHPPRVITVDEHLQLRLAEVADAEEIAALTGANVEHLRPWMPWASSSAVGDVDAVRRRRQESAAEADAGTSYTYRLLVGGVQVGMVGLHRRIGPDAIEIGYWLAANHTGRGLITRAVTALTEQALRLADVARVEIHCDEANTASAAVPRRCGYRLDRIEDDPVDAPAEIGRNMVWVYPP